MARRGGAPHGQAVAGERGVAVAGDVVGSLIVTGDDVSVELVVGPESGALLEQLALLRRPKITKRPPPPPPRRSPDHVGRGEETASILGAVRERPVNVHGEAGIGKTWVLRDVADRAGSEFAKDGVTYLAANGRTGDELLQELFRALYDATPPTVPSSAQVLRLLGRRRALVLLDSLELEPTDAQALVASLPTCPTVCASRERVLWDGMPLTLGGLALGDALAVIEQELGRPLAQAELSEADRLWRALAGNPLRLRQAAAVAREQGVPIRLTAASVAGGADDDALALLNDDEREVLAVLAALGGAGLGARRLARVVGRPDVSAQVERLRRLGLAEADDGLTRVAAGVATRPTVSGLLPAAGGRLVDSFLDWVRERPAPGEVARELSALVAAVELARRSRRPGDAVELGRAADPLLALSAHWDEWGHLLETVREAARVLGDRKEEAWALHQLGTRAACLGDRTAAAAALGAALELRRQLGDEQGARVTSHNLDVGLERAGLVTRTWNRRLYTASVPLVLATIVGLLVLLVGGAVAAYALSDGGGPAEATLAIGFAGNGDGAVTIAPTGLTCSQACEHELEADTRYTLRPIPADGSRFAGWTGCPAVVSGACDLELADDLTVTARFALRSPESYELRVSTSDGRVASGNGAIDCPGACAAPFAAGATVTLTATPNDGFVLERWEGCAAVSGATCEVVLNANREVTAVFAAAPTGSLTVSVQPSTDGTVTGGDGAIACPPTCTADFPTGTTVTLTATPNDGFALDRWDGCTTASGATCEVAVETSHRVTAVFRPEQPRVTLTVGLTGPAGPSAGGSAAGGDGAIACPGTCSASFPAGTLVTLTATPDEGFYFTGWRGCDAFTGTTCQVVLNGDRTVTAVFREPQLRLTVSGGTITYGPQQLVCEPTCTAGFPAGTQVTLTASPDDFGEFTSVTWGGACAGRPVTETSCTITVDEDTTVSAEITTSN